MLLHFDGLTAMHYRIKMLRHRDVTGPESRPKWPPSRVRQVLTVNRLGDRPAELAEFLDALRHIKPVQARVLRALGYLHDPPISPISAVRALCPEAEVDETGFDAVLAEREADLLAQVPPAA